MEWLQIQYEKNPNKRYINDLTFAGVYERVCQLGAQLQVVLHGQQRVGVYATNSVDTAILLLALFMLRLEVVCLNARLTEEEMKQQAEALDVHVVLTNRRNTICWNASLCCFHLQDIQKMSVTEDRVVACQALMRQPLDPNAIGVIMNTSATTGQFKSVPMRWKQWMAHVKASAQQLGVRDDDVWLTVLPIFHVSGLSILLRSLYNGTAVWIEDHFDEATCAQLMNEGRVSLVSLVPTMWKALVPLVDTPRACVEKAKDANAVQLGAGTSRLRCVLLGGEFIPQALVEASLAKGLPVYKTYGMTETASQSATVSLLDHPDKKESVGFPLPGVHIDIANPDKDGIGTVILRSPMLMDGYIGKPPLNGYLDTGDIGYVDEDGYLYLLNRRKDLIISGGENIYPKEIEDKVYAYPGVRECAVVGEPHERWGQVPVLYVAGEQLKVSDLHQYLQSILASYKVPRQIYVLDALPRNATGKIVRRDLIPKER